MRPRHHHVCFRSSSLRSGTFLVGDLAYGGGTREVRVGGGVEQSVRVPLAREGWYDLAVGIAGEPFFRRRWAGRVPTSLQGVTDPAMGLPDALGVTVALAAASATIDEAVLVPGHTARIGVELSAREKVTALEVAPVVPPGWPVRTVTAPPVSLAAGASAKAVYAISVPGDVTGDGHRLLVTARGRTGERYVLADDEISARTAVSVAGHPLGEDFESVANALQPSGGVLGWTATAPSGWKVVNAAGMPRGTPRLQGWTFHTKRLWQTGGQDRADFTRALGVVAVADPDDWDDSGSPSSKGRFDSSLVSPPVELPEGATRLYVSFDSHYRQEAPQEAELTAAFDDGTTVRLLHYSSATSGNDNLGKDAENTYVARDTAIPAGARSVTLTWRVFNAANNWYWAVDHVRADVTPLPRY
ncbi:hypothetical protein ACWDBD_45170 [Streptomyces sp. NPDC001118]